MRSLSKIILTLSAGFLLSNCGGGDDGGGSTTPIKPAAAIQVAPLKDAECNTGTVVSTTESTVSFQWNAASNADSYTLVVTNLNSKVATQKVANTNSATMTLLRGVPYSWKVISKSSKSTETATSEVWKFYNAGVGVSNYAPFPAEAVSPIIGNTTATSTVTLKWSTSDIDNDITKYEVYLGTTNPPTVLHTTTTNQQISNISLTAKTTYYWKVVTTDSKKNSSSSPVFDFRTQ